MSSNSSAVIQHPENPADPVKEAGGYSAVPAKEEQYRLLSEVRAGNEDAKEQMVLLNMGLVKSVVTRFSGKGLEWDDLMQIGSIGLVKAIERFDPSFDVMFSTYAIPMILGEIKRYIRDDGRIKLSRDMKTSILRLRKEREAFCHAEGRQPKLSELAGRMEISVEDLLAILEAETSFTSIESLDDPQTYESAEFDSHLQEGEDKQIDSIMLRSIIENLPPRERQIIILRYFKDMTQSEIAKLLDISQVHVSRLEKKILKKIGASF